MAVTIRLLRPDDREFVDKLGEETAEESVSPLRPAPRGSSANAFHRMLEMCARRDDVITLIAQDGDTRAGFLILVLHFPDDVTLLDQAFIAYMAVAPEMRRRGVASALLVAAEEEARRREVSHISLMVTETNMAARELYEGAGFLIERMQMTKRLPKAAR